MLRSASYPGMSDVDDATSYQQKKASAGDEVPSKEDEPKLPTVCWFTAQGFCLAMDGVFLQIKDGWTFPVQPNHVVPLIEAGVIPRYKDRAKTDAFAKGFILLQSEGQQSIGANDRGWNSEYQRERNTLFEFSLSPHFVWLGRFTHTFGSSIVSIVKHGT
ncbi:uncharacterized protein N7477_002191 [Penicillium maclennaniae]|uniref:uncharacterized protein n=1 Tax=Penicillium maclennaniae TaxID=1343394 RepID=UPI0025408A31|nr:uncharacterized protein N7477_002191 [Penicillium maclennaniae]KAJ5676558.1 hypothetical protein N7477_002191 [Penicillium maclennaniae]